MATASAVRWAAARPERVSHCRSSSRSFEAIWAQGIAPKAPLNGPSQEAKRHLIDLPIDYYSGTRVNAGGNFVEHFRLEADGHLNETQYQLVSQQDSYGYSERSSSDPATAEQSWGSWGWGGQGRGSSYYPGAPQQQQPVARGFFAPPWSSRNDSRSFFWGDRPF